MADTLCPELTPLLESELAAGNSVLDSGPAPGTSGTLVRLARSFQHPVPQLPAHVILNEVNDPHWWKSEYRCDLHGDMLVCTFDQ